MLLFTPIPSLFHRMEIASIGAPITYTKQTERCIAQCSGARGFLLAPPPARCWRHISLTSLRPRSPLQRIPPTCCREIFRLQTPPRRNSDKVVCFAARVTMRRFNALLLVALITFAPALLASGRRTSSGPSSRRSSTSHRTTSTSSKSRRSATPSTKRSEHVSSYTRKNGTKVQTYKRATARMARRKTATVKPRLSPAPSVRSSAPPKTVLRRSTVVRAPATGATPESRMEG